MRPLFALSRRLSPVPQFFPRMYPGLSSAMFRIVHMPPRGAAGRDTGVPERGTWADGLVRKECLGFLGGQGWTLPDVALTGGNVGSCQDVRPYLWMSMLVVVVSGDNSGYIDLIPFRCVHPQRKGGIMSVEKHLGIDSNLEPVSYTHLTLPTSDLV